MNAMKDWPAKLKLNAQAAQLAPALYYSRCLLYDADAPMWEAVSPELHKRYIDIATRVLFELAPPPKPYLVEHGRDVRAT